MTGGVYTWGHCANGRLGIGDTERVGIPDHQKFFFPVPSCLSTLETITQISCGTDHTLAIGLSGLWVWGSGAGGKLGLGDNLDRTSPVLIPVMKAKSIMQVSAGYWHSMAGGT
jgi:alpha-tubulin suppressor-like RCC1 family protein